MLRSNQLPGDSVLQSTNFEMRPSDLTEGEAPVANENPLVDDQHLFKNSAQEGYSQPFEDSSAATSGIDQLIAVRGSLLRSSELGGTPAAQSDGLMTLDQIKDMRAGIY